MGFSSGGWEVIIRGGGLVAKSRVGLVGPMSNDAALPQLVEGVLYRELDGMRGLRGGGGRSIGGSGKGDGARGGGSGALAVVGMSRLQESSG